MESVEGRMCCEGWREDELRWSSRFNVFYVGSSNITALRCIRDLKALLVLSDVAVKRDDSALQNVW